jgi:hypothetical protein
MRRWRHSAVRKVEVRIGVKREFLLQAAGAREAKAIVGEGAITPIEKLTQEGRGGEQIERIGPPNVLHYVAIDLGALDVRPVCEQEPEIVDQFFGS